MSKVPVTHEALLNALRQLANGRGSDEHLSNNLRAALLDFGSETPDNVNCASRIEVGTVETGRGLKFKDKHLLLSEFAYQLEDAPMPDSVKRALPEVTEQDWDAFMRFTVLLYLALEPA